MLALCFAALLLCAGSARASSLLEDLKNIATKRGALAGKGNKNAPDVAEAEPDDVVVPADSILETLQNAVSLYCRVPESREEYAKTITDLHKNHSRLFYDPISDDKSPYDLLLECGFDFKPLVANMSVRYPISSEEGAPLISIVYTVPRIWHTGPMITAAANLPVDVLNTKAMLTQEDYRYGSVAGKSIGLSLQPFLSVMYLVTLYKTDIDKFKKYIPLAKSTTRDFVLALLSLYNPDRQVSTIDAWSSLGIQPGLQTIAVNSQAVPFNNLIKSLILEKLKEDQNLFDVLCSTIVTTVQQDTSDGAVVTRTISPLMDYLTMLGNNGEYNMGGFLLHYLATNQGTFNRLTLDKQLTLVRLALNAYPFVKTDSRLLGENSDFLFEFLHAYLYNARIKSPHPFALEVPEPKTAEHDKTYVRFARQSQWLTSGYCRPEYMKCASRDTPALYNLSITMQLCVARSLQSEADVVFDEGGLHIPCECMDAAVSENDALTFYDFVKYNAYSCLTLPEYKVYNGLDSDAVDRAELNMAVAFYLDLWYHNQKHMSKSVEMNTFVEHLNKTSSSVMDRFWEPSSDSTPAGRVAVDFSKLPAYTAFETLLLAITEQDLDSLERITISELVSKYFKAQFTVEDSMSNVDTSDGIHEDETGDATKASRTGLVGSHVMTETQNKLVSVPQNSDKQTVDSEELGLGLLRNEELQIQTPVATAIEPSAHTLDVQEETDAGVPSGTDAEDLLQSVHLPLFDQAIAGKGEANIHGGHQQAMTMPGEETARSMSTADQLYDALNNYLHTTEAGKEYMKNLLAVKNSPDAFPPNRNGSQPLVGMPYIPDDKRILKVETPKISNEHGNSSEQTTVAAGNKTVDELMSKEGSETVPSLLDQDYTGAPRAWWIDERGIPLHAKVIYWLVAGGVQLGIALWVWLYVRGAARAEAEGAERSAALRNPRARAAAAAPPETQSYRV